MTRPLRLAGLLWILALACQSAMADFKTADAAGKRGDFAAAIAEGNRMIASGDPDGEVVIGWAQNAGSGMPKDEKEGLQRIRRAAEKGSTEGERALGVMYGIGWLVEEDLDRGIALLRRAADKGHPNAMANLGALLSAKQEHVEATQWFKKGAEAGDGLAQYNLGWAYMEGNGVEKDMSLAIAWLRRAAIQGNGLKNLGVVYEDGLGVKRSRVVAYALYSVQNENDKKLIKTDFAADEAIKRIAKTMTPVEIAAGKTLMAQMLKPGQLLVALDRYAKHPQVKELDEAEEEAQKIAAFRKALKAEDNTNCGPVIDRRGNFLKVYFPVSNFGNEHWIRRDSLFPSGYGCKFVNGQYVPPQ